MATPSSRATAEKGELVFDWLNAHSGYGTTTTKTLAEIQSPYQKVEVYDTQQFGKLFRLDGRMMTSEADEFFYHECMTHPAALAHPNPESILVIGGGDGGSSEELLKHPSVKRVVMAELDPVVIDISKKWLGAIHNGAFDDPRLEVKIGDGFEFVKTTSERFDMIVLDLTDPDTPAFHLVFRAILPDVPAHPAAGRHVDAASRFAGVSGGNGAEKCGQSAQGVSPRCADVAVRAVVWFAVVPGGRERHDRSTHDFSRSDRAAHQRSDASARCVTTTRRYMRRYLRCRCLCRSRCNPKLPPPRDARRMRAAASRVASRQRAACERRVFLSTRRLHPSTRIELPSHIAHHALRVLRLRDGEPSCCSTASGGEFAARLAIEG